jgi:hypothetical protein
MLRIFITTSQISCAYMTLYARSTWKEGMVDVLLVDTGVRRSDVIRSIERMTAHHRWNLFKSYSQEVSASHRFQPTLRKRLTRKWKELPLLRPIYAALLERHLRSQDRRYAASIQAELVLLTKQGEACVLHAHTETYLLRPLRIMFPDAKSLFFEHGQGDYIYIDEGGSPRGIFFALFAEPFKRYVIGRGGDPAFIRQLDVGGTFAGFASVGHVQRSRVILGGLYRSRC